MEKLLTFIQTEVEATERDNLPSSPATKNGVQRNKPASVAALVSGHYDNTCSYCQGKHLSANCKTVTNVTARRNILKRSGRCFVCLKKNYISKECQSNNKCFKCGRQHHASLCIYQRQLTGPNFNQSQFKQQDRDPRQPPAGTASSGEHSFQPAQGHEGNQSAPSKKDNGQQQQEQPSSCYIRRYQNIHLVANSKG